MVSFVNDYCEGAHPEILEELVKVNYIKHDGYCKDRLCAEAESLIRRVTDCPDAAVWFLTGGTQTNQVTIDSLLRPYEGVIAAGTGHVAVHESGAVEFTGHKVLTLEGTDGKLSAAGVGAFLKAYYEDESYEHIVTPGMVYISQPTELGTMYTAGELTELHDICAEYGIPLYMDGARLAEALAADRTLTLADYARLTDVFYIGGTKCGALFGEALVFTKNNMPVRFESMVKQHGALLAKGWLVALQFRVLLQDDLYVRGGENALRCAEKIKAVLKNCGYRFFIGNPTNQIFVIMENGRMEKLKKKAAFSFWERYDDSHTVIRFVTSWATSDEDTEELIACLREV